ncbi:hypothetical protein [Marinomonas colpomeniae]|jgi:hypothetical protein|uniref:Uncharacterized protein n=1 Tax=Marinomonas colpomeniae TaxID=2774408 RepID=A0ABR8P0U7_9GAMM|nr:hypothetical protein [Marinomonas colpomeniae]MBD5770912.1 hypothetical protein [Marinomonas colpomeniae]
MPLVLSINVLGNSMLIALLDRLNMMSLAQWVQHYQAETVDLRYFFHSGWSS